MLQQQSQGTQQPQFIPDPNDIHPPSIDKNGNPKLIPDPSDTKPELWDDEDDGEWEAAFIENPDYHWEPRMIPSPNYVPFVPPPTLFQKFKTEMRGAVPWLVLGVAVASILHVLSNPLHFIGHKNLSGGTVYGAIVGLMTPLCSCGALPVAAGMADAGVPLATVVSFLTASQSSGLDSASITWGLLGPMAALCRLVGAVILGVAAGSALPKDDNADAAMDPTNQQKMAKKKHDSVPPSPRSIIPQIWDAAVETASESFPSVFAGLALSTIVLHYTPSLLNIYNSLLDQTASSSLLSTLGPLFIRAILLILALPLQLCEHTTATLAAALRKGGASPGLAFAFLISAPATNLPTLLLLFTLVGRNTTNSKETTGDRWKRLASLRVAMALSFTSLLLSYIIDFAGIDMLVEKEADGGGSAMDLPSWFMMISPYLAALLSLAVVIRGMSRWWNGRDHQKDACCGTDGRNVSKATTASCYKKND